MDAVSTYSNGCCQWHLMAAGSRTWGQQAALRGFQQSANSLSKWHFEFEASVREDVQCKGHLTLTERKVTFAMQRLPHAEREVTSHI